MFGLRVPLAKSLTSGDFDGVQTILYNSGLRESSQWVSRANRKGEIFLLELQESSNDQTNSDKDCLCTCSDCATDDTGYGTDSDLYSSFRKGDDDSLCHGNKILSEFSEISDVISTNSFASQKSERDAIRGGNRFVKAEEDIDSLFRNVSVAARTDDLNCEKDLLSAADVFCTGIDDFEVSCFLKAETGAVAKSHNSHNSKKASTTKHSSFTKADTTKVTAKSSFTKADTTKVTTTKHSSFTTADTASVVSVVSGMSDPDDIINTSINEALPPFPRGSKKTKSLNKSCESCASKNQRSSLRSDYAVNVKLRPQHNNVAGFTTVELCEYVLGFVPGHYGSNQGSGHHRRRDRRIKVRGILPNGVAAMYPVIHVGDCMVTINDQDITWDNLKNVLHVLVYQRQAKLVFKRSSKQKETSSVVLKKQSASNRLVQLVTGANGTTSNVEELLARDWEPFYGAMYLSLEGVNSDNMQAKDDIVYQFPRVDNKVIDSRGMFITLAGTLKDATHSNVQSTTLMVGDNPVHIVYRSEGQNLFVVSAPENRFSLSYLTVLVQDLVRVLEVTHGSIQDAFTSKAHHQQLDCFFALLHQNHVAPFVSSRSSWSDSHNLSQSINVLPLPNDIKMCFDRVLSDFDAADFGDMGDSYYGCRRSYSILGSCLFYKNYLVSNHLPKDDLIDFTSYLRYHSLFSVTSDLSIGQLVTWKEVHPTRLCQCVPEEQPFGYTEPLIARWFWLIVGYKNMIMCVMLEKGGCTSIDEGVASPDPFLIDQARAVLMQIDSQNLPKHCQNSITSPIGPLLSRPDIAHQKQQSGDLLSKTLKKLPHRDGGQSSLFGSVNENHSSLRRVFQRRKDSIGSDNSSESSGDSVFKFAKGGRMFPENTDILHNINENRDDLRNTSSKLTVGADNCLFHFQYYDNLEGVCISSEADKDTTSQLNNEVYSNFKTACKTIKGVFDNARKVKEQTKDAKSHIAGLNDDFTYVREEGVMFTCESPVHDKKQNPLCYWVVGRCLSRSLRREVYVCFQESVPQTVIELAFKMALGYLPV